MTINPVVSPAFQDEVHDAQRVFRALMSAMSRPGSVQRLKGLPPAPVPWSPAAMAVALALCDHETPVWLDALLRESAAARLHLSFHTDAPMARTTAEAAFAFFSSPQNLPMPTALAVGTDSYPDRSTTVIVEVETLEHGRGLELSGPGIDGVSLLRMGPLSDGILALTDSNRRLYPRGTDIILTCGDKLAALSRTTRIGTTGAGACT